MYIDVVNEEQYDMERLGGRIFLILLIIDSILSALYSSFLITDENKILIFLYIVVPWLIIFFSLYDNFENALDEFLDKIDNLPFSQKFFYIVLFYAFNFLFVVPVLTPYISFTIAVILPYALTSKLREKNKKVAVLLFILLMMTMISIHLYYLLTFYIYLAKQAFDTFLSTILEISIYIYHFAILSGASASIADFILIIYEGAHAYDPTVVVPYRRIKLLQIVLILSFSVAYLIMSTHVLLVTLMAIPIALFSYLVRYFKGINRQKGIDIYTAILYLLYLGQALVERLGNIGVEIIYLSKFLILLYAYVMIWISIIILLIKAEEKIHGQSRGLD